VQEREKATIGHEEEVELVVGEPEAKLLLLAFLIARLRRERHLAQHDRPARLGRLSRHHQKIFN
jgi:hypothetical protein